MSDEVDPITELLANVNKFAAFLENKAVQMLQTDQEIDLDVVVQDYGIAASTLRQLVTVTDYLHNEMQEFAKREIQ